MQQIQKFKVVVNNGKVAKEEALTEPRNVVDSVADNLVIDGENTLKMAAEAKKTMTLTLWKEVVKETPKPAPVKKGGRPPKKA